MNEYCARYLKEKQQMEQTIINLNVGGLVFQTSQATINKDKQSLLYAIVNSDNKVVDSKGNIFIDRDSQLFRHILYFLRTGSLEHDLSTRKLEDLWSEADFYELKRCMEAIHVEMNCREWNNPRNWRFNSDYQNKNIIVVAYPRDGFSARVYDKTVKVNIPYSVKFEISTDSPRKVLYRLRNNLILTDCVGHVLPGLTAHRNKAGQVEHYFTSNERLKELPNKSVFFLAKGEEWEANLCLLGMMQMDHMIHQDWEYFWNKIPNFTDVRDENCCFQVWTAPIVNRKLEPPTK